MRGGGGDSPWCTGGGHPAPPAKQAPHAGCNRAGPGLSASAHLLRHECHIRLAHYGRQRPCKPGRGVWRGAVERACTLAARRLAGCCRSPPPPPAGCPRRARPVEHRTAPTIIVQEHGQALAAQQHQELVKALEYAGVGFLQETGRGGWAARRVAAGAGAAALRADAAAHPPCVVLWILHRDAGHRLHRPQQVQCARAAGSNPGRRPAAGRRVEGCHA